MKLGAEPKKVAILAGLLCVAGYFFIAGRSDETGPAPARRPAPASQSAAAPGDLAIPPGPEARREAAPRRPSRSASREFRPSLKPRRAEDRPDPMTIDPTLRLNLLARLQEVEISEVKRSLFDFAAKPAPKVEEPKIVPKPEEEKAEEKRIAEAKAEPKKEVKPPPPPINLKFYGYISPVAAERRRAFFLDGEDIFIAGEGDLVKKKYKIIRIGVNSAVVEDTEREHRQTLKLEEIRG